MRSASQWVHAYLGSPVTEECSPRDRFLCWLCGGNACPRGMVQTDWQGSNFVGQNRVKVPGSLFICEACVYVCARANQVPNRPAKEGKKFGGNWRNYSHWIEEADGRTVYGNASKGEKPSILAFLMREHPGEWACAIADSGQKHVLPWTPVNPGGQVGGRVLFDERIVTLPASAEAWSLVGTMASFLTEGATKEEIDTGEYSSWTWGRGAEWVRGYEQVLAPLRASSWFALALWLAQRNEADVAARMEQERAARKERKDKERDHAQRGKRRGAAKGNRQDPAGGEAVLPAQPGGQPTQGVGADPGSDAHGGKDRGGTGGVGDGDAPHAQPGPTQLAMQLGDPGSPGPGTRSKSRRRLAAAHRE